MILWILGRFLLPKAGATAGIASGWVSLAFAHRSDQLSSPPKLVPSFLMPLPLSLHDCTFSQRSQTPSQLPSSWDLHPLPLATVGAGRPCSVACPHYYADPDDLVGVSRSAPELTACPAPGHQPYQLLDSPLHCLLAWV